MKPQDDLNIWSMIVITANYLNGPWQMGFSFTVPIAGTNAQFTNLANFPALFIRAGVTPRILFVE